MGKRVCDYWQNMGTKIVRKAKQEELNNTINLIRQQYSGMEIKTKIKEARASLGLEVTVSDELQYLEGENGFGYLRDMLFCQMYAKINRQYILSIIVNDILKFDYDNLDKIETIHNYIDFSDFIIRKGAVRSYVGERFLLPYNMRDGMLICEGKSNPEYNYSSSHGAGRLMSRTQAKKIVDLQTFKDSMIGIFSTSVGQGTLDESPMAYKDSKLIESLLEPTASIIDRVKPVMNLKDGCGSGHD